MAIVLALQKWRHYLLGRHFKVWTDQKSLRHLLDQREIGAEQLMWLMKLQGYDFEIQYKLGGENKAADALSRKEGIDVKLAVCTVAQWGEGAVIDDEVQADEKLKGITQALLKGDSIPEGYTLKKGSLLYKGRLVLSRSSTLIPKFLQEFHAAPFGGHLGYFCTYKRSAGVLFWEGMKSDIKNFVAGCEICQRNKHLAMGPAGLLHPLPIP